MKRILLTLTALASFLANAQAVDDKTFFSGAHLGMTLMECMAYYHKVVDGHKIADAGSTWWGGATPGEKLVDFRSNLDGIRRVLVCYREADWKILSLTYWKLGNYNPKTDKMEPGNDTFSPEEMNYLIGLNRGRGEGPIVSHLYKDDGEFEVTTTEQDKLEQTN